LKLRTNGTENRYLTTYENEWNDEHTRLNVDKQVEEWRVWKLMLVILKSTLHSMGSQWSRW